MTRLVIFCALAAGALAANTPSQAPPQVPVVIDAVAVDRDGMPVMDLKRDELEVWIAGYRVPIERLTPITAGHPEAGRSVVLILDDIMVPMPLAARVRDMARRFVERMAPGDEISIVMFEGGRVEGTGDRRRLLEAIDSYQVRTTGVIRLDTLGEQVLNTVSAIARQLTSESDRRNAIVAIGAAPAFDTPIPPPTIGRELRKEWTEAMRSTAFSHAAVYVIDPRGLGEAGEAMLRTSGFARETGGLAFVNSNDFDGAVDRIMRESANYYLIEVKDPPVQRKADLREMQVRGLRRGVTVRARRAIPGTAAADARR